MLRQYKTQDKYWPLKGQLKYDNIHNLFVGGKKKSQNAKYENKRSKEIRWCDGSFCVT